MNAIKIKEINGYCLRVVFSVNNSGAAFAKNDYGYVRVVICHWENEVYMEDVNVEAGRARLKSVADSIGRDYIRKHNLRDTLARLASN